MSLPGYMKPFKYKTPRIRQPKAGPRLETQKEDEGLTGLVNGEPASAIEERFARALWKRRLDFDFNWNVYTAFSLPNQKRRVDFVVHLPPSFPIEIDGEIAHKGAEQKEEDRIRDATIDDTMMKRGWMPIRRVDGSMLSTQQGADSMVSMLFV